MTVGDIKITAAEYDALTSALPPEVANAMATLGKRGFAERYASLLRLAKEGEKRKVDQGETFRRMLSLQRLMLLANLTGNQLMETVGAVTPEEVSKYYASHQSDFQQVKLRGIFIPFRTEADSAKPGTAPPGPGEPEKPKLTEAQARAKAEALRGRIVAGEDMAALAEKESEHPTASQGGDFGFVGHGQLAPQIDSVIFALQAKQVSAPVRDRFGYFIFRADEKRTQSLEELRAPIENGLRQQKVREVLSKVESENPITYNPRYFGEPMLGTPAAPVAPPK